VTLAPGDFEAFFAAVHDGQAPFAWQRRLLDSLRAEGRWPDRIMAPTGAGKTAVIDVHVFAVALMAAGTGPRVPRRLSLVVDRRALVDSQFDLARKLNHQLREAGDDGILGEVRRQLASLWSGRGARERPLIVTLLRGGVPASRRWVDDPTAAAIICATPAMWGSRLLFRGYGTGDLARPREAGLLAYDSVVVVDEAHLARQLVATARRIDDLEAMASEPVPMPRIQVVEATATIGDERELRSVDVAATDLEPGSAGGAVLARRLLSRKPVTLTPSADWPASTAPSRASLARMMADQTDDLLARHGRTVACVTNTVSAALGVATELRKRGRVVELLVGRLRPHDIAALRTRRPGLLAIGGNPDVEVVVATQTIEVGVDADFSAMVTELAAGSALAQRAGRVNRLGERPSTEVRVVVPTADIGPKGAPPYEAGELTSALAWITRRASNGDGLAPFRISQDPPPAAVLRRLVLGRPEAWDALYLARTSDRLFAEPDLDLWLSDDLEPDTDVSVVVRQGMSPDPGADLTLLRVTPPRAAECFPASIGHVRALLARAAEETGPTYRWRGDEADVLREADEVRPGDIVVVSDRAAWFTQGVVDSEGREHATDVLEDREEEPFVMRLGAGLPMEAAMGTHATAQLVVSFAEALEANPEGRARRAAIRVAIEEALGRLGPTGHPEALARLARARGLMRLPLANVAIDAGPPGDDGAPWWIVIADQRRHLADEAVRQTWSASAIPVSLAEHQAGVAARAAEIGTRLALGEDIVRALEHAGALHDEGKRDPRFQQLLLDPGGATAGSVLAKSGSRTPAQYRAAIASSGLPTGWRHEQLSAVVAWEGTGQGSGDVSRLVTRLVGTSHGHGRCTFPHTTTRLLGVHHELAGTSSVLHDAGAWDALIDATHRSHGVWGCAYLEAILRAADGQVSGEADGRA
jgi:CRISPR-associated endonuclease/helicase Cas3